MIASNTTFPQFVPDQLLTSGNLNSLFNYLDEQGRISNVNLTGIGIICGLDIILSSDRTQLTITGGCGITSEGYLINIAETVYTDIREYDAVKPVYYDRFINPDDKTPRITVWELLQEAVEGGTTKLHSFDLDDKVVLIFAELIQEQNKNCDPDSCDDKGITVTVRPVPLLVSRFATNYDSLKGISPLPSSNPYSQFRKIKLPRFNVSNTYPVSSTDLFRAYINVFKTGILSDINTALTQLYTTLRPRLRSEFPANPFTGFPSRFSFLTSESMTQTVLIHCQHFYSILSDITDAYTELTEVADEIQSLCNPDSSYFPRHVLLGEAVPRHNPVSQHRHYFISSPALEENFQVNRLRCLFRRLVQMIDQINLPPFVSSVSGISSIRVTPDHYGNYALSSRSIPFYYRPDPLYKIWSFEKSIRGREKENLSYHAASYNVPVSSQNDIFRDPLKYNLESHNFLRIEGHIGKTISAVLNEVNHYVNRYRLPVKIVALKTGNPHISSINDYIAGLNTGNLEISYDIARREWEGVIGKTIQYLNAIKKQAIPYTDINEAGRLVKFIKVLQASKQFMTEDLTDFVRRYDDFIPVYEKIEEEAKSLSAKLESQIKTLDPVKNKSRYNLSEDLIDHLDAVIFSCLKGPFRALYQEFTSRLDDIYSSIYFKSFAEKHPGIQHRSGVTLGGTFILVYHENEIPANNSTLGQTVSGIAQRTVIADFFLPYTSSVGGFPVHITINDIPPPPNQGPVANAGPDQQLSYSQHSCLLDGSASSDPDGAIAEYRWEQVSGPVKASVNNPDSAATQVEDLVPGSYVFQLTVTDNKGDSNVDTVTITVAFPTPADKKCKNLNNTVIVPYWEFTDQDSREFHDFMETYVHYDDIHSFFRELQYVDNTIDEQLKFFTAQKVFDKLMIWISILPEYFYDSHADISLRLLRILTGLAVYVVCIQDHDITRDESDLPAIDFFDRLLQLFYDFQPDEKIEAHRHYLRQIRQELIDAENSISSSAKPEYKNLLDKIINQLNTLIG